MVDNAVTIEQLQAELRRVQELHVAEVTFLRQREAALIDEVEQRDRALAEAVEQQTATADILRVIASSPTDLQPVLDAIVETAARLCDADIASIVEAEDGHLPTRAVYGWRGGEAVAEQVRARARAGFRGVAFSRRAAMGTALLDRRTIDVPDTSAAHETFSDAYASAQRTGIRSQASTPLLHGDSAIGVLSIFNLGEPRPFTDHQLRLLETFADQAVIAIENARLFEELEQRNAELQESNRQVTEALEQQTVTAEILRVIASSPTDVQPVLDTIVASAQRLTDATGASLWRIDGGVLRGAAAADLSPSPREEFQHLISQERPINSSSPTGRAALERRTIRVVDMASEPDLDPATRASQERRGFRSQVATPLTREGDVIGVLVVNRRQVRPFSDEHVALLETFADQAVIAIENARLFEALEQRNREVSEALEQQTATAEVLRVIASSPSDLRPVLDAIAESAAKLCEASDALIHRIDGDAVVGIAQYGSLPAGTTRPPINRDSIPGRTVVDRQTVHIHDLAVVASDDLPARFSRSIGVRTVLATPLLRDGVPIGTIMLRRTEVRPFTDRHVSLLETFADQAVIAIENARLFEALEQRNREVSEALEQQTATAEVLRVIASSPTDLQRVLDTITESAARLCEAPSALLLQFRERDGRLAPRAWYGRSRDFAERNDTDFESAHGVDPIRTSAAGRAYLDGRTIHVADMAEAAHLEYPDSRALQAINGMRTVVYVPLLRHGVRLGVFSMQRSEVRPFTDKQIMLLETFADQAVIAIENARLFQELQGRVSELQALGEVGQAVSSTLDLQEVLTTIVTHATRLAGADAGTIFEFDAAAFEFTHRASYGLPDEVIALIAQRGPQKVDDDSGIGRAARTGAAVQVVDIRSSSTIASTDLLDALRRAGFRAQIAIPLVRDQRVVGVLVIRRKAPGELPEPAIALLQTFASQSVLAIENARLFAQVQETSRELEAASQHKSQFLANMSHELRTPLNAIIGYSEMLQEEAEEIGEEAFIPDLQKVNAAGKHLLGLINDILDLSKIEAGRMDLYVESFEVSGLIRDVKAIVQPLVDKNGNALVVDCPEAISTMQADLTKVRQTLFNLLSNASKFTEHGTISLTVEREAGEDGDWITFAVADTGIGMTDEQLGRLFEAFSQAEASTRSKYGGTGLGLAISRAFCRMMGGDLTATSVYGEGSMFTMRLPTAVAEPAS